MENSQIPRYLFGLSTTFPLLSLFTPRNQDLVFCCQKEFPRAGARPLHPSSSFTVLQCYTRGNPFKAGPGRAETKKAEKKRRKMWFCSNKLGGQPPRCVWRPWLSRPTNPQVESVSPVERLLEQRPNCAHLGFRGLEGICCCLLPTCRFHPFPPRHVLSSGIEKNPTISSLATPLDWPLTIVVGQYPPPEMDGWLFGKTRGVDDGLLGHHHYLHHDPLWSLPILARLFETIFRSEIVLRDWLESRELFCCTQLILYEWNFQVKRCDIRDGMIDFLPWNFAGGSSTIRMKKSTAVRRVPIPGCWFDISWGRNWRPGKQDIRKSSLASFETIIFSHF